MSHGKHRRPSTRSTSRTLLNAGVVVAATTGPIALLAGAASAAPAAPSAKGNATYDKIAQCESHGKWNTNTGNGHKGGLQFSNSTWKAYGGGKYAPSADKASREEQIAVAKKVQAEQGWSAWPQCSKKAGVSD